MPLRLLHLAALAMALAVPLAVLPCLAGTAAPAPLRIGVSHVPPKADIPAARLYTEEGFDADLAAEIGRRLGREVRLVDTGHEGAHEALAAGRVDALVVRLAEGEAGFPGFGVVQAGYASGLSVAMRMDTKVSDWADLAGRTVCVAAANRQAQSLARSLGAKLSVQPAPALSLMRVRTGECDAALHDEAVLARLFADPEWRKFSATLPVREQTRLVVVLPEAGGPQIDALRAAIPTAGDRPFWSERLAQWARDVALEVYLDQDAPDCH